MTAFVHLALDSLPSDWSCAHFGDLVKFRIGKTPPRNNARFWSEATYPWVSIKDMSPFGVVTSTIEGVSETAHREVFRERLVPAGSFLMSFKLTIGRIAKLGMPAYHNEAIISFQPDPDLVDPDYLAYYLSQINYRDYQDTAVKGMTLNSSKMERLEIACPPLDEQRKIAAVLSLVQRAIEQQERLIALTTELKKALMHKLFTEGLHGELQKETEIGLVPESWEVVELGEVCELGTGTTPATARPDYYVGTIPFVKTADILNNRLNEVSTCISESAKQQYNLKIYPPGTILMAMYGQGKTRGQVSLLEISATTTQNAAAILPRERLCSTFLWQVLMNRYDELRASGSLGHISHLNLGYVRAFRIPLPATEEQQEISTILECLDSRAEVARKKRRLLDDLFCTLLHQLMTAHIRVDELDQSTLVYLRKVSDESRPST